MDLHFASVWEAVADTVPDSDVVVMGERRITYRQYDDAAARFASAIEAAGVQPGANVSMYLYNCPEYLIAQYGATKNGCGPINVNYRYLDEELVYLVDNSDSEVLVFHTSLGDRVERVRERLTNVKLFVAVGDGPPQSGPGQVEGAVDFASVLANNEPQPRRVQNPDDVYMLYTGGTTGMPKGVMYQQAAFLERMYQAAAAVPLPVETPTSLALVPAFVKFFHDHAKIISVPCCPLMHGTGMWVGAMPALGTGGTVVLLESRSFDADELLRVIESEQVTRPAIVGDAFGRPIVRALEAADAAGAVPDLTSVNAVISSGAMWSSEIKTTMSKYLTNAVLIDALGSTEGGSYGRVDSDTSSTAPTAKFQLVDTTLILDEIGEVIPESVFGTGLLASETPARGYYKDPEKSARTFKEINGLWYVITGDWATREPDGSVTLHGRGSNCINSGGEKIFPEEVEEAIKTHPSVDDCYVVGVDDEKFGQRVVAVASAPNGGTPAPSGEDLRLHLRELISGYKIPKQIVVVAELKRAPNGKADYGWARDTIAAMV